MRIAPQTAEQAARADDLRALVQEAQAKFDALPPVDKAMYLLQQRRSAVHGLSPMDSPVTREQRDAIIDEMPEYVVLKALMEARERIASLELELSTLRGGGATAARDACPFADPAYVLDVETPCPVCGDLGTSESVDGPSKCVSVR